MAGEKARRSIAVVDVTPLKERPQDYANEASFQRCLPGRYHAKYGDGKRLVPFGEKIELELKILRVFCILC